MTFVDAAPCPVAVSARRARRRHSAPPTRQPGSCPKEPPLMRNVLRAFLAAAAIAATALAGSASIAAASSDNLPSFSERYETDDAWCFDYGDLTDCSVQHLTMVIQYKSSGDATLKFSEKQSIVTTDNATGLQVGSQRLSQIDKTVYED